MNSSGSLEFDRLKAHLDKNATVKREVEFAFSALLAAADPSDRGTRFLFGNGAEWILACAAWSAGVLTAPEGHNKDGFDLGDLLDEARSIWSVKASASKNSSAVRLINFMGDGKNARWDTPTVFIAPYLRGAVFIDPRTQPEIQQRAKNAKDALTITGKVIRDYADAHPENRIYFDVAVNTGQASNDAYAFIKSILDPRHFPILSRPFDAATPTKDAHLVDAITQLAQLKERGSITQDMMERAIAKILND